MRFVIVPSSKSIPDAGKNIAYLRIDHWNDFSFVTMFDLVVFDEEKERHELGKVKIGFKGQDASVATYKKLGNNFEILSNDFFSLGMDVEYYQKISNFSGKIKKELLVGLKDIVYAPNVIDYISGEQVFKTSLLRDVSLSVINGQYARVLEGGVPLTDFKFKFVVPEEPRQAPITLEFKVIVESKPSTNIHAIIGRNGVGKTSLLNKMTEAITSHGDSSSKFIDMSFWGGAQISKDYFSSLVSVSFSAFDPFTPPPDQPNPAEGTCYSYIGIKSKSNEEGIYLKSLPELHIELLESISICFSQAQRKKRWLHAIDMLQSDENFADMKLDDLTSYSGDELEKKALAKIKRMSSGHAIVFLTITKLVATVEEKTLVLIDEPESHLHPPLLSAFIRALSQLLYDRNGVAIIATHSPVVIQEIPTTCVWKILRSRLVMNCNRPDIETFGENVGILTREVFGLEVVKSGFHQLLAESVGKGLPYEEIVNDYADQLGNEARAILKAMVLERDKDTDY
ncbi:MAG: AAA family ATPase [Gammaproteobacteria bacterium]